MKSFNRHSLKLLREQGFLVAITEHWNSFARIRQDLFGFADLLAFNGDLVACVQVTAQSCISTRIRKIAESPLALPWLASPARKIWVHGWAKKGPRGAFVVKTVDVTVEVIKTRLEAILRNQEGKEAGGLEGEA